MSFEKSKLKLQRLIKRPFSSRVFKNVQSKDLSQCKLVMTLLVKNEVDVIRQNIEFHLKQGVDFIVATDNVSDDGTLEILKEYEHKGVLFLIVEKNQNHDQAAWVNKMGLLAYQKFNANIIFHCDADEFWYAQSGNLKTELISLPLVDILNVNVKNVLMADKGLLEKFPEDARFIVADPIVSDDVLKDSNQIPFFLFSYPTKVQYKLKNGYLNVTEGNHRVKEKKYYVEKQSTTITIYHFPLRGIDQFYSKVVKGGASLERNELLDHKVGWHWRRWYEAYKKGELESVYRNLNLSDGGLEYWINQGVVVEDNNLVNLLGLVKS